MWPLKAEQPRIDRAEISHDVEPVELVLGEDVRPARRATNSGALSPRDGAARACDRSARRRRAARCVCRREPISCSCTAPSQRSADRSERTSSAVRSTCSSRTNQRNATCNRRRNRIPPEPSRGVAAISRTTRPVHLVGIDEGDPVRRPGAARAGADRRCAPAANPVNGVRSTISRPSRPKRLAASVCRVRRGFGRVIVDDQSVAATSAIEPSIALRNGSSRGPRIRCAATPAGESIAARLRAQRRSFRRVREAGAMPPLRLAVDARVIAEDTRGIGRYARAILRRLVSRDDVELTLLADGLFPHAPAPRRTHARWAATAFTVARASRAAPTSSGIPPTAPSSLPRCPASRRSTMQCRFAIRIPIRKRREHAQRPFLRSARHRNARHRRFAVRPRRSARRCSAFRSSGSSDRARRRAVVFTRRPRAAARGAERAAVSALRRRSDRRTAQELRLALRSVSASVAAARWTAACDRRPARAGAPGRHLHVGNLGDDLIAGDRRSAARLLSRRARARARVVSRDVRHADARSDGLRNAGRRVARELAAGGRRRGRALRPARRCRRVGRGAARIVARRRICASACAPPGSSAPKQFNWDEARERHVALFHAVVAMIRARRRRLESSRRSARHRPLSARDSTRLVGARAAIASR